ncbi:hypothetical protein Pan258_08310 [Symmachiella dynata]|uniref:MauE/DoxX family redox-associated membrane protein n=1 Tax=Symmachiella dynata TaxID=2527995 RepID=UPI00118D5819|nr:MauE/DoxX family redox-associated membrane protein [Symmachiella dynata]QDT46811.1 hypothetical protein Pan258_08310 [Symmachiella dynata]
MSDSTDTTQSTGGTLGWESFRFAVAALLFATAVVKIVNMAQILTGGGLLGTMPRLVAVTAFEAAVAVYLIVGNRCLAWLLTLTTFAIFVASTLYAISMDQPCDCFGGKLEPETVVVIDAVVLLLTACLRPRRWQVSSPKLIRQLTVVTVVAGLVAGAAVWRYDVLLEKERSRLLVAEVLVGKPWPLNGQTDPRLSELGSGKWMILIARQDCGHCREMVAQYFADPETHRPGERTAFFVFGGRDPQWRFQLDRVAFDPPSEALLSWPDGEPYVINPAIFLVENGIVIDAAEGTESEQFLGALLSGRKPATP